MSLGKLYEKIASLHPCIEVFLKKLYWKNVARLKKHNPHNNIISNTEKIAKTDFTSVINYLRGKGVGEGSLLIVHSSYDALSGTGLNPKEIIERLLDLIGEKGTLAMPVIRKFPEEPDYENVLTTDVNDLICTYDVRRSVVTTGLLPHTLMRRKGSVTSRFPLNPMTAVGPLAADMMRYNLDGDYLTPHGINSSWKFCLDHGAVIVGLGIDLSRYLTITHVAEEAFPGWLISDDKWYHKRIFDIKDGDFQVKKVVLERKPEWGRFYYTEYRLKKDLLKYKILQQEKINDINVGLVDSRKYISFLKNRNKTGYPYYIKK